MGNLIPSGNKVLGIAMYLIVAIVVLMCFAALIVIMLFSQGCIVGCDSDKPTPRPSMTATPIPDSSPAMVQIGHQVELRVGGEKVIVLGLYHLVVDIITWPTFTSIEKAIKDAADAGVNGIRVWSHFPCSYSWITPWMYLDELHHLNLVNQAPNGSSVEVMESCWKDRFEFASEMGDKYGVTLFDVVFDGWEIRKGFEWDPINPENSFDPFEPKLMTQEVWDIQSEWPRQRRFFKCKMEGDQCSTTQEIGGRKSVVQWNLVREVAALAARHDDVVYLWSEMMTDPEHSVSDAVAMRWWHENGIKHVHELYPGAIIGTSVGAALSNCDAITAAVFTLPGMLIADCHGGGYYANCDYTKIDQAKNYIRSLGFDGVMCANSDACMSSPRYTFDWVYNMGKAAWQTGVFPEFKTPYDLMQYPGTGYPPELLRACRQLRDEEYMISSEEMVYRMYEPDIQTFTESEKVGFVSDFVPVWEE